MAFVSDAVNSVGKVLSGVGNVFSAPSGPAIAPAPVAPTPTQTASQQDTASQTTQATLNRGRSSTILNGGAGLDNLGTTSKVLLGQ